MKTFQCFMVKTILVGIALVSPGFAVASDMNHYDAILTEAGYELSESGMRRVLEEGKSPLLILACMKFIASQDFVGLLPDVEAYLESIADEKFVRGSAKFRAIECLISIKKDMSPEELAAHMKEIRKELYEGENTEVVPNAAYQALLQCKESHDIYIKADLMTLGMTDILRKASKSAIRTLFAEYSESLTEEEIFQLRDAWQDNRSLQSYIFRHAKHRGLLLDTAEIDFVIGLPEEVTNPAD